MTENEIATAVINAAFTVHIELGPGLLESVYETALEWELIQMGFKVERQKPVPVIYRGVKLEDGFRLDLLVNDKLIVEVKSVPALADVFFKILLTYLRLTDKRLGLLINFGEAELKNGLRRVVNRMPE
ncbi:MAG: GxxExxY protein [Fimbriimonadaceae bacterium]